MSEDEQEYISKLYNCPKCKTTHSVKINKRLGENRVRYPFPYVFLHSSVEDLKDLLTLLYVDAQFQIRSVDIIELEDTNIFSEELTKEITEKLMSQIIELEQENLELKGLLSKIEISESIEIEGEQFEPILLDTEEESIIEEGEKEESAEFKEVSDNIWTIQTKTPGRRIRARGERITLFFISTIGPGEKKQKLTIDIGNLISEIKETIGHIYGLNPPNFHFSVGGVTLDETKLLKEYKIADGDEVLIIPSSTAGKLFYSLI